MSLKIHAYTAEDEPAARAIWNRVVRDADAFPQIEELTLENADDFFRSQTYTGIAVDEESGETVGLYILHPNNTGRCGHIANASYAVRSDQRGRHIGEVLVRDCLKKAKQLGFRILQFNAVVASNAAAIHLYDHLGFTCLGRIPGGYLLADGSYEDILLYYKEL
ncbi:MAG: GNAT family N-acetyltransferase [Lachnospiraceae bacterium]|jgi:L-amino acid N-acyltransferase YncA